MLIFSVVEVCFWPLKSIRPQIQPEPQDTIFLHYPPLVKGAAWHLHVADLHLHISFFPLYFSALSNAQISTEASTDVEIILNV